MTIFISYRTFQKMFHKHMKLFAGFLEKKYIYNILKFCRMKPYEVLLKKTNKLKLYDFWVDEFGSSIKLKRKKIKLIMNDLSIDRSKIVNTDQYGGLPISQIIKISSHMYFVSGFDQDILEQLYIVSLLGIDGFLRTFSFNEGWEQVSSLWLGEKHLKNIAMGTREKFYKFFINEKECVLPCVREEAWLTSLPAGEKFRQQINRHEIILDLIK